MLPNIDTDKLQTLHNWAHGMSNLNLCINLKRLECALGCYKPEIDDDNLCQVFLLRYSVLQLELSKRNNVEPLEIYCAPWPKQDSSSAYWTLTDFSCPAPHVEEEARRFWVESYLETPGNIDNRRDQCVNLSLTKDANANDNQLDYPTASFSIPIGTQPLFNGSSTASDSFMDTNSSDNNRSLFSNMALTNSDVGAQIRTIAEKMHRETEFDFSSLPIVSSYCVTRILRPNDFVESIQPLSKQHSMPHKPQLLPKFKLDKPFSVTIKEFNTPIVDVTHWIDRPIEFRHEGLNNQAGSKIPPPLNAFALYFKAYKAHADHLSKEAGNGVAAISLTGQSWKLEPHQIKVHYKKCATAEEYYHHLAFPRYAHQAATSGTKRQRSMQPEMEEASDKELDEPVAKRACH